MSDLDALLAGIVADPANAVRWLVMADWLEENGQPERAELVRVHRELLRTCTATRETKARKQLHTRMMELMRSGVQPCIPQRTITLPGGVEMRFSFIPPGSFLMGSPKSEPERRENERRHLVTLMKGFWLGVSPVTQCQWVAVGDNPSDFEGGEFPVDQVNWHHTVAFHSAVQEQTGFGVRLPTETEWEYATRAGTTTPFYWGSELNGTQANCNGKHPYGTKVTGPDLRKVTSIATYFTVSPHPWGLVDVTGNVWEWCGDWYDSYPSGNVADCVGPENGSVRVIRGGCRLSFGKDCRSAMRDVRSPEYLGNNLGFRVAADLSALA